MQFIQNPFGLVSAYNYLKHVCVCVCVFVLEQDSQSKQGGYSMHQLQGNKEFGCEKKGYLMKKSDGYTHTHPQL